MIHKRLGDLNAETLTAEDIEAWLGSNCKTPATFNRYKALLSLAYKLGIRNKKVTHNLAGGEFIPMLMSPRAVEVSRRRGIREVARCDREAFP